MLDLEVLVGKLLAVDGLATGTVATGEVTTLEHEVGDDAVEGRELVAEAVLASAELTEVTGGDGDNVVVEVELDSTLLLYAIVSIMGLPGVEQRQWNRWKDGYIPAISLLGRPWLSKPVGPDQETLKKLL